MSTYPCFEELKGGANKLTLEAKAVRGRKNTGKRGKRERKEVTSRLWGQ